MRQITSTTNPRVKLARQLHRKRHRQQTGLCVLEGGRLVEDAWRAGATLDTVFVGRGWPGELAFSQEMEAQIPVCLVSDEVLATISETVTPQGIVALARIPQLPLPDRPELVLVLDGLQDPGNAGTLLRTAAAAGVDLVLFGPGSVDPFNRKVLRAAMGAHFRVPLAICARWRDVASHLGPDLALYVAEAGARQSYDGVDWLPPSALIVGSEAAGPSPEALDAATPIAVPMQRETESLNAAIAGAVILFEAVRQRRQPRQRRL